MLVFVGGAKVPGVSGQIVPDRWFTPVRSYHQPMARGVKEALLDHLLTEELERALHTEGRIHPRVALLDDTGACLRIELLVTGFTAYCEAFDALARLSATLGIEAAIVVDQVNVFPGNPEACELQHLLANALRRALFAATLTKDMSAGSVILRENGEERILANFPSLFNGCPVIAGAASEQLALAIRGGVSPVASSRQMSRTEVIDHLRSLSWVLSLEEVGDRVAA